MSRKAHCDICDAVIHGGSRFSSGGVVETKRLGGAEATMAPLISLDLCQPHFNAFSELLRTWKDFQRGGLVSWPQKRVDERWA